MYVKGNLYKVSGFKHFLYTLESTGISVFIEMAE